MQSHLMKPFSSPQNIDKSCWCRDSVINLRIYLRFMEWCLIKPHTHKMFFAITGDDYRILMSAETNESAAHTWPLLALSCITVITPHEADFSISLCWDPSPFTYFHPDTMHIVSPYLSLSLPPSLSVVTGLHPHLLLYREPPLFSPPPPVTSSAARDVRDPVSKASVSAVRRASVTVSTPVWCWGIHIWQINPYALPPHIVLMSKVVRCVETGVTFSKDRHTVGSHYAKKQHIERKWWRAAGLMKGETSRKGGSKRI